MPTYPQGSQGPAVDPPFKKGDFIPATSDQRIVNNTMRVLSDEEKAAMQKIKDGGLLFHDLVAGLGNSRELSIAKTKIEEAVMWAVKHITA